MAERFVMVTQEAEKVIVTSKAVGFLTYGRRGGGAEGPTCRDGTRFAQSYVFMPKSLLRDLVLASGGKDPMLGPCKRFVAVAPRWLYDEKFSSDGWAVDGDAREVEGGRPVAKMLEDASAYATDMEDYRREGRGWKAL